MKRLLTLTIVCLLAFTGFAQTGKVGVNTTTPAATLDVKSQSANNTDEIEGLLAPRISKEKAYLMATATTKPDTSNLVFVTDTMYTFPTTATDVQKATVEDVLEKGYYFWNGDKWVSMSSLQGSIWKYADEKVFIDRSSIVDNVEYLEEGGYRHFPRNMRKVSTTDSTGAVVDTTLNINGASIYKWNLTFSDLVKSNSLSDQWPYKALAFNTLYIDEKETSTIPNYYANWNRVTTTKRATRNFGALYGALNYSTHYGTGSVYRMIGTYSNVPVVVPNSNIVNIHSAHNQATFGANATSSTINLMNGTENYVSVRGNGTITNLIGTRNRISLFSHVNANITNFVMTDNVFYHNDFKGQVTNWYGTRTRAIVPDTATSTSISNMYGTYIDNLTLGQQKNYGLRIENVGNNTATENYAIYTNKGKVRLGDTLYINKGVSWTADEIAKKYREVLLINTNPVAGNGDYSTRITSNLDVDVSGEVKDKYRGHSIDFGYKSFNLNTNPYMAFRVSPQQGTPTNADMTQEHMRISSNGNVGIGTSAPAQKLHVSGVMRLEPQDTPPTGASGDLYVGTDNKLYFHNGTAWKEVQLAP